MSDIIEEVVHETEHLIKSIPVHIRSSDVKHQCGGGRKRRSFAAFTFVLTTANQTQPILPASTQRVEAWVTSIISGVETSPPVIYVGRSEADAQQQAFASAAIDGTNVIPFPINTTDSVYASALTASLPVSVSVVAIYEQDEQER